MKLLALPGKNGKFLINPEQVQQIYGGDPGWSIIRFTNGDTAHVEGSIDSVAQLVLGAVRSPAPGPVSEAEPPAVKSPAEPDTKPGAPRTSGPATGAKRTVS